MAYNKSDIGDDHPIEIGSFIEYPLPAGNDYYRHIKEDNILKLNTCRAAIYHAIRCYGVKKVWIAKYQCEEVIEFLQKQRIQLYFYDIDYDFNPLIDTNSKDSAIVLANYFGILGDEYFIPLVQKFNNVIIDNAHAFFYHPLDGCMNCYSPRKFVSCPDGGYVIGDDVNKFEYGRDYSSDGCQYLLMRYEYGLQDRCYSIKKKNDLRVKQMDIMLMSPLTEALLDSYNYDEIIKKRRQNYILAKQLFDNYNASNFVRLSDSGCIPIGYPFYQEKIDLMPILHKNCIFQPRYWEYLLKNANENTIQFKIAKHLALLCIDQRYGKKEIEYQYEIVKEYCRF